MIETVDELRAEVVRLRALIHRDQTGLAAALCDVVKEASARLWVVDGRGAYAWDDDRYRQETGLALRAVIEIAKRALGESGALADSAFHPERPEPPAPTGTGNIRVYAGAPASPNELHPLGVHIQLGDCGIVCGLPSARILASQIIVCANEIEFEKRELPPATPGGLASCQDPEVRP